ncbi:MAG: NADH:ubiquinone reductase (Na(+)-transporting) subunit B [Gammaproteobacteria bacterium AqS3]|nr:NADH:ubiquinone reductase (Na(+)-transporting) subunit B [Gammaproteobacteria bacterium AqS3]
MIREFVEKFAERFQPGAPLEKWYPAWDAVENFVLSSGARTTGASHIRDGVDMQRIMVLVWFATFPAMFWGMYNVGWQANSALMGNPELLGDGLQAWVIGLLSGSSPDSIWDCLVYGAVHFVPIYAVTFMVGAFWEILFAVVRRHEINEGFFVSSVLFALCCPPDVPLWQVALGISFGIVIGKEIFGGTGKNFLNPALTGRAFLYLAYPAQWSGSHVWVAVDGYTQATPLGIGATDGLAGISAEFSWMDAFLGVLPGSVGEVSTLAIALGGAFLLITRVASWRIVLATLLGTIATASLLNWIGSDTNPLFALPWYWHIVLGGYAFGLIFMATEPVSGPTTNRGRWFYGFLIGFMVVLIRVMNPGFPEGMMFAILFANLFAPLFDYFAIRRNAKIRAARAERLRATP